MSQSGFQTRVRQIVSEEMRDVYRLFQDCDERREDPGSPIPWAQIVNSIYANLREMKEEIRHIERAVTSSDESNEESDTENSGSTPESREWHNSNTDDLARSLGDSLIPQDTPANPALKNLWEEVMINGDQSDKDFILSIIQGAKEIKEKGGEIGKSLAKGLISLGKGFLTLSRHLREMAFAKDTNNVVHDIRAKLPLFREMLENSINDAADRIQIQVSDLLDVVTSNQRVVTDQIDSLQRSVDEGLFNIADCCSTLQDYVRHELGPDIKQIKSIITQGVTVNPVAGSTDIYQKILATYDPQRLSEGSGFAPGIRRGP